MVPWASLQCVIVAFPGNSHYFFYCFHSFKREPKELSMLNSLFHRMFSTENLSVQFCSLRAVAEAYPESDYDALHGHNSTVIIYSEKPLSRSENHGMLFKK